MWSVVPLPLSFLCESLGAIWYFLANRLERSGQAVKRIVSRDRLQRIVSVDQVQLDRVRRSRESTDRLQQIV